VEQHWQEPDEGIWEVRSGRRHFTHSKVMAWVAIDRAVQAVERFGLPGPAGQWRKLRTQMHEEICQRGVDPARGCFVRAYGSAELDASLLLLPLVGFLPPGDPRVRRTLEAIQDELCEDGFVRRYRTDGRGGADGLAGGEGAFLACSFWLVDNLVLAGRRDEAQRLLERLAGLRNDVGCWPRNTTRPAGAWWGTSPRPSPTSGSSTPPSTLPNIREQPRSSDIGETGRQRRYVGQRFVDIEEDHARTRLQLGCSIEVALDDLARR
jgi:GH15 family glucan-1,4-alpha-glucosidase